jgi:integrating conjugative element protein (TIGR03749 family)
MPLRTDLRIQKEKKKKNVFFGFVMLLSVSAAMVQADVRRVWDEKPLTILLPVGKELRVTFPTDVAVQVPLGISEKLTSLAPNNKMIYWTATETFNRSRVIATATDGRTVYVIDVEATNTAAKEDILIEDPARVVDQPSVSMQPATASNTENENDDEVLEDPAEILLTRFAAQTLYAPSRLMPTDARISPVNFLTLQRDFPLLQSGQGEQVAVTVVGAWVGFGRHVTAVFITNQTNVRFEFDASRVRGNFTHITAQHREVGAKGSLTDRTTLYLISTIPFAEALTEDSYAY